MQLFVQLCQGESLPQYGSIHFYSPSNHIKYLMRAQVPTSIRLRARNEPFHNNSHVPSTLSKKINWDAAAKIIMD